MKQGIVKKIVTNLILSLTLASTVATSFVGASEIVNFDNSSTQQTIELCEALNVDDSYRHKKLDRLQHNGDEPIYISISNEFTEEQKTEIKRCLNYIFNLIGEINNKYKFEIVNNVDNVKYLNKSTIEFSIKDLSSEGINGRNVHLNSLFSVGSKGVFNQNNNIHIDSTYLKESPENLYKIVLHELLHSLGIDDIYEDEDYQANTYINIAYGYHYEMITPNDYKLLLALYTPKLEGKLHKQAYINTLNKKFHEYSQKFYENHCSARKQHQIENLKAGGDSEESINYFLENTPIEGDVDVTFEKVYMVREEQKVRVKVKNGKYTFAVYDKDGKLIEKCSGKAYNVSGEIYLQDVRLHNFSNGKNTYTDFIIALNTYNNKYDLNDFVLGNYSNTGVDTVTVELDLGM